MMAKRRLLERPRPWHVLLAPALPLVSLLFANRDLIDPRAAFWPALVAAATAVTVWLLLSLVVTDHRAAALVTTTLVLTALNHQTIAWLGVLVSSTVVVPLTYAGVLCIAAALLRAGHRTTSLTQRSNEILVLTLVLLGGALVHAEWRRPKASAAPLPAFESAHTRELPDVYVIILDGYGRADVLRDQYGFENALVPSLRSMGFFVADKAASNYSQTAHSMASALNMDYLTALLDIGDAGLSRRGLGDLIADNRAFHLFARAGYDISAYASEYQLVKPMSSAHSPAPIGYMTDFAYAAYESSVVPPLFQALGLPRAWAPLSLHRRHVRWTLDDLARRSAEQHERPRLVFAHVLAPHPPFAFNADGSDRQTRLPAMFNDGDHWKALAQGSGETYRTGYVEAVRFLNTRIEAVVRRIVSGARRPTLFYIQGDHGPASRLEWENAERSDMRERHAIMLAMRFPDEAQPPLDHGTTPINAFRVLMNRALGTTLRPVEDRSYFATWERPFQFIDVTDRVHAR